ncbi:PAS/PAC sensor-containing diguanylate cyclase/phosphodiesterase [Neobacillus bataviensis LMG 21833]|uniref:PAS/PAC sensor-containing diguanylate cyclase/phosphodiesterase n=1 Tax=Neobacillus bataviensis LMG 21833 TaxID=1117379 RepID=K6E9W0_9BACI|nr:PilZ domain-containing protein [Neobacillus bataviensis]EKN70161.1 PAS/PAC sensor-containing diguanylate cyclase/phosphodiesterase [Neobacillus bataviensis LMG 21833]
MTLKLFNAKSAKKENTHPIHQASYRIQIKYPFDSEMTLLNLGVKDVETENPVVFIENIGPGGLRFLANLPLMGGQEIIFSLEADILEDKIHLPGDILWCEELTEDLYQYGVHFHVPESTRSFIHNLLQDYSDKYFNDTL